MNDRKMEIVRLVCMVLALPVLAPLLLGVFLMALPVIVVSVGSDKLFNLLGMNK